MTTPETVQAPSRERQTCTKENPMPKDAPGMWQHAGAYETGGCSQGCCAYYECRDCGHRWKAELGQ